MPSFLCFPVRSSQWPKGRCSKPAPHQQGVKPVVPGRGPYRPEWNPGHLTPGHSERDTVPGQEFAADVWGPGLFQTCHGFPIQALSPGLHMLNRVEPGILELPGACYFLPSSRSSVRLKCPLVIKAYSSLSGPEHSGRAASS